MDNIYLHFDGVSLAEANRLSADLREFLQLNYKIDLPLVKEKENTQDVGSILEIILGAKSIVDISKGIATWLIKKNSAKITVKTKTGNVIIDNVRNKDIPQILKDNKILG